MKYKIQIDMAEFGEPAIWQDVKDIEFESEIQAYRHIGWMKTEYGDQIEYRVGRLVQDRKTGNYYDPQAAFDELMQRRETMAMLERLAVR